MMRSILPVLALLCMVTVGRAQVANIVDPRLQIELPTVKGDKISLSSLKGKVILLDFWASWCMPCRSANRKLVKLYDKYKTKGFEIYSVSLDDEKADWEKAIRQDKISWLQVNEPTVWGAESARRWNISALPTTFLINKKGDVVAINIEGKELDKEITRLLAE
ncbi:MAG: TlpA family protein disulfide reductase [Chitinophagaceae bacterium]|nr:MAG: TlpA family protein disulfide reductase [Chitinophagaceae bacterium]